MTVHLATSADEGRPAGEVFDVAVVGGGSAGCVVAGRLAESGRLSVLLLECGDSAERNPETLRADGYKDAFANDRLIWDRFSEPQPGCAKKRLYMGSGRGLGGSGAVNAMVYTRGARTDFDEWPVGWRWDDVVGDYEALEQRLRPHRRPPTDFTEVCIEAAREAGFRVKGDLNDGDLADVIGYEWMNYEAESRRHSYAAFLREPGALEGLTIRTGARATRVELGPGRRARSVVYIQDDAEHRVSVRGEVVLCAGALETPKLLMLSGIGPGAALRARGIDVVLDAPAVGGNLHDHPNVTLFFRGARSVDARYPQLYGFARALPGQHLAPEQPDTCYVFYPAPSSFREAMKRMLPTLVLPKAVYLKTPMRHAVRGAVELAFRRRFVRRLVDRTYGLVVILGKPRSRGRLSLASRDPAAQASIDPGYYTDPLDLETMVRGVERARAIAATGPLAAFGNRELAPGPRRRSREAIARWIAKNTMTTFHYAGSCHMGAEAAAPVDPQLRLRGVAGLRIADASVIPSTPVSAMNAPSMLVGWRAASYLLAQR